MQSTRRLATKLRPAPGHIDGRDGLRRLPPQPMTPLRLMTAILMAISAGLVSAQEARVPVPPGVKVVLVTGSTDGLGREVALRLGASGAHVIVHGRNRERGEAVVREIERGGKGSARFYAAHPAPPPGGRSFAGALLRGLDRPGVLGD